MPWAFQRRPWSLRALLLIQLVLLMLILAFPGAGHAQATTETTLPSGFYDSSGRTQVPPFPVLFIGRDSITSHWCVVGATTTCVSPASGGGGGGGGDASAANQASQITIETAISAKLPSALGSTTKAGSLSVTFASDQTLPAFAATPTFNLGTLNGASTAANQSTELTDLGGVTETAPASDTASSGLNGRLQRLAQSITTLNGKIDTLNTAVAGAIPAGTSAIGALTSDTHAQCAALCANLVVKASAGTLKTFEVSADSTLSAAIWYVIVYDATAAPADGAITPAKCYQQASGTTQMGGTLGPGGTAYATGITIGVSTTGCFSKTASTHAFIAGDFQ